MSFATSRRMESAIEQAFNNACEQNGDLGLQIEVFSAHLLSVIERNVGGSRRGETAIDFLGSLHTKDLYLALGCAQGINAAWHRFNSIYRKYLMDHALRVCPNQDAAMELAESLPGFIYEPDGSGHSRLASYDGRSSLATWLRIIVSNRAFNERENRWSKHEGIESVGEIPDSCALSGIDACLRSGRYEHMIQDAFKSACGALSDRERLLLLLRYDKEIQLSRIARLLHVHPSTITRQLERIYAKLRTNVREILVSAHNLDDMAMEECVAEIVENPNQSILAFIRQT